MHAINGCSGARVAAAARHLSQSIFRWDMRKCHILTPTPLIEPGTFHHHFGMWLMVGESGKQPGGNLAIHSAMLWVLRLVLRGQLTR
jgi:hypothetical protein